MPKIVSDEGLIIKKYLFPSGKLRLTVLTRQSGKLTIWAYGVKKITSRRLSHLETGNKIKFNYTIKDDILSLQETELQYGHSKIKSDLKKLKILYSVCFIVEHLIPIAEKDDKVYFKLLNLLQQLNNQEEPVSIREFYIWYLLHAGYIDKKTSLSAKFDPVEFISELIGREIP